MKKKWISEKIDSLDTEKDFAQIVDLMMNWRDNSPFLHHTLYTIAFIRQVADPEVADIVYRNGGGRIIKAAYERANETMQFFGNWYKNGPDSANGMGSIEKMNAIHKNFNISNQQYLYTLATLVVLGNRFKKLVGLKENPANEKKAFTEFWKVVGRRMHLTEIPETYEEFDTFYDEYEKANFNPSEVGLHCCEALIDEFTSRWFADKPKSGRRFLLAHFDDTLRAIYPLEYPNKLVSFMLRKMTFMMGWYGKNFKKDAQKPQFVEDSFTITKKQQSQTHKA